MTNPRIAQEARPHQIPPPPTQERTCPSCEGAGWLPESRSYDPKTGEFLLIEALCRRCAGSGVVEVFLYPPPSSRTRTVPCCHCGSRERVGDTVEAQEDDPMLLVLAGDRYCVPCAGLLGIAR